MGLLAVYGVVCGLSSLVLCLEMLIGFTSSRVDSEGVQGIVVEDFVSG